MMKSIVNSHVVQKATLVKPRPFHSRIYAWPFGFVYAGWLYVRIWHFEDLLLDSKEFSWFTLFVLIGIHCLLFLVCHWSVQANVAITCTTHNDPLTAKAIMVLPTPHNGAGQLCDLQRRTVYSDGAETQIFFFFQKRKFVYNSDKKVFEKLEYLSSLSYDMAYYKQSTGIGSDEELLELKEKYGMNRFDVPVPSFQELFKEHVVAPFFVFQIFCVMLWFLDEMWYYSLFTLFMLFVFESTVVFQRLRNLQEFRSMSIKPYSINVFRKKRWVNIQTDGLMPGDVCSIVRQKNDSPVPADILLLAGSCIANEAMLSGESTPQLKEPVLLREDADVYDINVDKNQTLFGGTKVLQVTPPQSDFAISSPDNGCLGVVLRTGFGTQQGKLVRTIIYATERVTANNLESLFFILFLLVFAIIAAWYVWTTGSQDEERSQSKLLLHCILIITSVVPPELPMELSMAVNNSLVSLSKSYIFCTEPFRIPFAGRIDIACFDKTGTLTAENLIVEGVTGLTEPVDDLQPANNVPPETTHVLAAAHALVRLEDGVIGDPMEKNTLESINWSLSAADKLTPSNDKQVSIHILRRFPFSSSLKRMSTVSYLDGYNNQGKQVSGSSTLLIAAKGAPETIKKYLVSVPKGYDEHYKFWARRGKRVLALAYRYGEQRKSVAQINEMTRDHVEKDLKFAGFLIFYCPLKPDSTQSIRMLNQSSHRVVMITGDNALTACHIAKEVEIVKRDVLIGDIWDNSEFSWQSVDEKFKLKTDLRSKYVDKRLASYDLCCTGPGLDAIAKTPCFDALLSRLWVYARVSPAQKELILTRMKQAGYFTLMCGDGTNDVGALKQAHVGIALLDSTPDDLKKLGDRLRARRQKEMLQKQEELRKQWGLPPTPGSEHLVTQTANKSKPADRKEQLASTMGKLMEEMEGDVPVIKFGDASVAAPFTSKISSVMSVVNIVRQGRATLVAMIQMYKILALNSLIMAYSLSVLHLAGIKQGDWQATIAGMLITACFFGIAKSTALEKLSKKRPQPNIFNLYIVISVLGQAAVHVAALIYIRAEAIAYSEDMDEHVALDAEFQPNLLNSAVYLVSLVMQISTFAINYQGQPFRESILQNRTMFNSLVGVAAIAFGAAAEISDDLNDWMQLVPFPDEFRNKLLATMALDYGLAWIIEMSCSFLFSDNRAKPSLFPA